MSKTSLSIWPFLLFSLFLLSDAETASAQEVGTFQDPRDGQEYPWVNIAGVKWMSQNLNFNSPSSDAVPVDPALIDGWGRLYPREGLVDLCPSGWRVPDLNDWKILEELIDSASVFALFEGKHWKGNEELATNSSGLSLVPSGFKHKKKFLLQYINSTIWFLDSNEEGNNWHFHTDGVNNKEPFYFHTHEDEVYIRKFAVRCVADE